MQIAGGRRGAQLRSSMSSASTLFFSVPLLFALITLVAGLRSASEIMWLAPAIGHAVRPRCVLM